ncbi:insulinase family protein [Shewanella seohaensis]|uniref:insulinase family protein n=1 Tax=Shewanella seohaensis TaxID=755175 RepID=UPI0020105F12|nr:insulinase family protein [Shewanella seohaensis]MCL1122860.1 insulinase family protein [Shewanella seohaensis]
MQASQSIYKSPNDHRQYRYLVLDNALRVLLVEDLDASQAAASMAVAVGHFDDPVDRPGMAHFLEHMLFLGTEKFPDSGEYHAFINQHGGSNNAWTGTEHTNFFFTINADVFADSLDRFSQFFIAPKFDLDLVDRERQAIESEFSLKLKDDIRRTYQVLKETVNQQHPFSKFSVGNLVTLGGEQAQVRSELLAFYQSHYSANLMTLCLVAPMPLDELQALAAQYFSAVRNLNLVKQYPDVPLFSENELLKQINIVPLKEQKRLSISFNFPGIDHYYKRKPLTYISHILGNESKGSLLSYLKEQGLVNNLSAGGGVNGYNFKDYSIGLQLTDKGVANIDDIVCSCFEYIELIKNQGLEDWRYLERANLLKMAFRYQEQVKSLDLASHLSINMHHYEVEDLVFGDYRMDGLDINETLELLNLMTPQNMRLQLIAQSVKTDRKANWYHTPYQVLPIKPESLARWQVTQIRPELQLPAANPFIVADSIARPDKSEVAVPVIVAESTGYRIWHKKDDEFNVPKGHMYLSLDSEQASKTPKHAALTRLYVEMLLDYLTEPTYQAEVAGLSYNIYPHQGGITLHLSGFTGNQETLLALLIQKARERNFTEERFALIKSQLLRSWQNLAQAKPISQLFTSLTATLQKRSYEPARMAQMLENITLNDLHNHVRAFYEKIYLEGLIYGDWLVSEAQALGKRLEHILSLVSSPSAESTRELINLTGQGTLLRELAIDHQDSAIIVYYQSAIATPEKMALFSLLNHTMSSTFFHELRTEKQLGYMVGTGYLPLNRHPGLIFYIQSPTTGPLHLLEAIDEFIADFNYAVMQITNEEWESTKQGLINQVMEHDANLKTRGQRYWVSVGNRDYQFNQRELVVAEINKLTRPDLIKFMMRKMRTKHSDRLVLFSTGSAHAAQSALKSENMITDLKLFKQNTEKFNF